MLDDPRRERFAHALAAGATPPVAYREAGYRANRGRAERLAALPAVQQRVAALQAASADATASAATVNVASLTDELEAARQVALAKGQASAAVSASLAKAKLHGLMVERPEPRAPDPLAGLSAQALRRRLAAQLRELATLGVRIETGGAKTDTLRADSDDGASI